MVEKEMNKFKILDTLKLLSILIKIKKKNDIEYIKIFIKEYYSINNNFPDSFYELILNKLNNNTQEIFNIVKTRNIYKLISYLIHNSEDINGLDNIMTPNQYYIVSKKSINKIINYLKKLEIKSVNNELDKKMNKEAIWILKKNPNYSEQEYRLIAYKLILSIGLDNSLELLNGQYGEIDYEKIHFLFSRLNVKEELSEEFKAVLNNLLFNNKKDFSNITRQMISGNFIELFLNFDYFYNNFSYFINKLGAKMNKTKIKNLLNERYLTKNVLNPEITGDVFDDMLSSYYHKYDFLDIKEKEVIDKNIMIYNEFLKSKYKSSIAQIDTFKDDIYICEVLNLSDPRNLVLGYRAGNCFRINGDAALLFRSFLKGEHMRLVSISTIEYKDFAMMLVMRNGNVLIGQGIEVSKRVPKEIQGKKLYDVCRKVLREIMEYMNKNGDNIVATIIGSSNSNVSKYNSQILPFLINPILDSNNTFYNGIYNYQCLLDISEGKSLNDIKIYIPSIRYLDKREDILRRIKGEYTSDNTYMEIEKRLIYFRGLRFFKMDNIEKYSLYEKLLSHNEVYTVCNKDWYITLFDDGEIDGFLLDYDERAKEEYDGELANIRCYLDSNTKLK